MADKIKEKAPVRKELKEKVKAAPKELLRRGLFDGTQRLRGQLRETAQQGQRDDYGSDQIEDAAWRGGRWGERGIEKLLKKKKSARERLPGEELRTPDSPAPLESPTGPSPESPAEPSAAHEPPPRDRPRIKTREAVSARESGAGAGPPETGRKGPSPGERMQQTRIKTKESAVHDLQPDVPSAPQTGSELPQTRTRDVAVYDIPADVDPAPRVRSEPPKIKTRGAVTGAPIDHTAAEPPSGHSGSGQSADRLSIKTRGAYIQSQPATAPEQPPQALVQGKQEFMRERGRTAAIKRAEAQRVGNGTVPQVGDGGEAVPPAPARRRYAGGQSKYAPAQTVHGPVDWGEPDTRPVRDGGRKIVKTARSGKKTAERTGKQTIKTAERSAQKAVKTAQQTAKTAQQTVKTAQRSAQATVKATQRAAQTAHATAKAAATTAKAAAKATVAAIKAAIAATQELIAAIAAGGWVVLVVVLVICMIGLLIASPFGIFFADGSSPDAVSPTAAIVQINGEYADRLSALQAGGTYDRVEIQGRPPSWADVFAVFAAKTAGAADGESVAVLNPDTVEKLRVVFWDMTKITTAEAEIEHPAEGGTPARTEKVLTITVTPRTPDDMRVFYVFTNQQNAALDELLTAANREMWNSLLYGSSGEIVAVALSQVGNVGGQPY